MKARQSRPRHRRVPPLPAALFFLTLAGGLGAVEPAAAADAKTYALFMGVDIDVQQGGRAHRVQNVAGGAYVIVVDDKPVEVPMNRGRIDLQVTPQLKLSDKTAEFTTLKIQRAYTPANNPNLKGGGPPSVGAAQSLMDTKAMQVASGARGAQLVNQRDVALSEPAGAPSGDSTSSPSDTGKAASRPAASGLISSGNSATRLLEDEQLPYDAALVTCEVSASRPVQDPYLVVIAYYRERGAAAVTKSRIFARTLERLDERPVKVRILQGEFPPGYELVRTQVHLYDAGHELGTNVTEKNVRLTREEAHEYVVVEHITSHKGATLPPGLAFGVNEWDVRPHYSAEQVQQVVYVKVTKDGLPRGAFRDETCFRRAGDRYLEQLLEQTRFKPALQAGKAVDGVAKLRIADLVGP